MFSGCDPSWPFHGTLKGTKGQYKARIRWRSGSERGKPLYSVLGPLYKIIPRRRPTKYCPSRSSACFEMRKSLQKIERTDLVERLERDLKACF